MNLNKYIIKKEGQMSGFLLSNIQEHLLTPSQFKEFTEWMKGQTIGCLDDKCEIGIVYVGDLQRFMRNKGIEY